MHITADLHMALKQHAVKTNTTIRGVVESALSGYLGRKDLEGFFKAIPAPDQDSSVPAPTFNPMKKRAWYHSMNIGDSVVLDRSKKHQLQTVFRRFGWGFRAAALEDGNYRVWRVEPTNA